MGFINVTLFLYGYPQHGAHRADFFCFKLVFPPPHPRPKLFSICRRVQPVTNKSLARDFYFPIWLEAETQDALDPCSSGREQDRDRFKSHFTKRAADDLFINDFPHSPIIRVKNQAKICIAFFWLLSMLHPHFFLPFDPFLAFLFIKIVAGKRHLTHYQWICVQGNIFRTIYFAHMFKFKIHTCIRLLPVFFFVCAQLTKIFSSQLIPFSRI
jgi:hypothetical protein